MTMSLLSEIQRIQMIIRMQIQHHALYLRRFAMIRDVDFSCAVDSRHAVLDCGEFVRGYEVGFVDDDYVRVRDLHVCHGEDGAGVRVLVVGVGFGFGGSVAGDGFFGRGLVEQVQDVFGVDQCDDSVEVDATS